MVVTLHEYKDSYIFQEYEYKDSYIFQELDLEIITDLSHLCFGAKIYCKIMIIKTINTTLYGATYHDPDIS